MKFAKPLVVTAAIAALSSTAIAGGHAAAQHPNAVTSRFLATLNGQPGPGLESLPPAKARQVLVDAQKSVQVDVSGIEVSNRTIEQDGMTVPITLVRPQGVTGTPPGFMYFHGGGWVLGDFPTHERLVRDLVVQSGAVAVFVNYTPSPEAHYPVAINQAYAATKWVAAHGAEIGVDGGRLAVVGNSVGGNMAAVVALMAKDKGGPKIGFQGLLWPVTDHDFGNGSYNAYQKDHFLTRPMMKWFFWLV